MISQQFTSARIDRDWGSRVLLTDFSPLISLSFQLSARLPSVYIYIYIFPLLVSFLVSYPLNQMCICMYTYTYIHIRRRSAGALQTYISRPDTEEKKGNSAASVESVEEPRSFSERERESGITPNASPTLIIFYRLRQRVVPGSSVPLHSIYLSGARSLTENSIYRYPMRIDRFSFRRPRVADGVVETKRAAMDAAIPRLLLVAYPAETYWTNIGAEMNSIRPTLVVRTGLQIVSRPVSFLLIFLDASIEDAVSFRPGYGLSVEHI